MTIGELKRELEGLPDHYEIIFGCRELQFSRLKQRGDTLIQMEFDQIIGKDSNGVWFVHDASSGEDISSLFI